LLRLKSARPEKAVIHSPAKLLFVGSPTILAVRLDLFF
jgi:hypothetical protein